MVEEVGFMDEVGQSTTMKLKIATTARPMSRLGHSRPARAGSKPGNVRHAPIGDQIPHRGEMTRWADFVEKGGSCDADVTVI